MRKIEFACVLLLFSLTVHAVQYKAAILSNPSYNNASAAAIDSGRIAGNCYDTNILGMKTPMLWANSQSSPEPLDVGSYVGGNVSCMHGDTVGGNVYFETYSQYPIGFKTTSTLASIWSASSGTRTDLHPAGYISSYVSGCWNNQQVGSATREIVQPSPSSSVTRPERTPTESHAILWNSSSSDYVNLNPAGMGSSYATAIWENRQVGRGTISSEPMALLQSHALMWQGTADSVVDLHPSSFAWSLAQDIWGNQQVGRGSLDNTIPLSPIHALLWTGSAESCIDLHPDGFYNSYASAVCNNIQVGYGDMGLLGLNTQALLWTGSAGSVVNLHQFLSSNYVSSSATDIDEFGNIVGTAKHADGTYDIVMWEVVPEPSTLLLLGAGCLIGRRWPKQKKV